MSKPYAIVAQMKAVVPTQNPGCDISLKYTSNDVVVAVCPTKEYTSLQASRASPLAYSTSPLLSSDTPESGTSNTGLKSKAWRAQLPSPGTSLTKYWLPRESTNKTSEGLLCIIWGKKMSKRIMVSQRCTYWRCNTHSFSMPSLKFNLVVENCVGALSAAGGWRHP